MAAKPEVVAYLVEHLKKFSTEDLRDQLASEGVTSREFEDALTEAKKEAAKPKRKPNLAAMALMAGGVAAAATGALVSLNRKPAPRAPAAATAAATAAASESGYVGHYGYVVRLPKNYVAVQSFTDTRKAVEIVHFCKAGTDPTEFVDEKLFGQLGIVRLQA